MIKHNLETRDRYFHFMHLQTRWMDNDIYGHINNVTYYSYFDTVVNKFLIDDCGFDPYSDGVIGVVVETKCLFKKPISFPERINLGLRIGKFGKTSIRYEVVDRKTNQPVPIPESFRANLERIHLSF
jgi:acyl-CoA thioester hydrolase